jgi:deoxyribodipyrimidine photo-lyase
MTTASRTAGLLQLQNFVNEGRSGRRYLSERNTDFGRNQHHSVSRLSPFIRHRLVLESEALTETLRVENPSNSEKFIQEIFWRSYWKGWLEKNPSVWVRYCRERDALKRIDSALGEAVARAKSAQTGIACFDYWALELVDTGYLHNHSRMWFASIWIFTLELPWQAGADFFMQHLCDADAASNTLSWRWVAGLQTKGKHYLARAENIERYSNGRFNPRGQLNEDAPCLTEDEAVDTPPIWPLFSDLSSKASATTLRSDSVLILHEDDLQPETFVQLTEISGLVVLRSGSTSSLESRGKVSQRFVTEALADARSRAVAHWLIKPTQIVDCANPALLARLWQEHPLLIDKPIATPWIPVGPTRDAVTNSVSALGSFGIPIEYLIRPWDAQSWPHANKGFFQFKANIPTLLGMLR